MPTPPDQRFIQSLRDALTSHAYVQAYTGALADQPDLEERFRAAVADRLADRDEATEIMAEIHSFDRMFDGAFIAAIREMTLSLAGEDRRLLEPAFVGVIPSPDFNARTFVAPNGSAVVFLNHAVLTVLAWLIRCTFSFIEWHRTPPFCRDSSQTEYALALVAIAQFVLTGDWTVLEPHATTLSFPSLPDHDRVTSNFMTLCEVFILLHEYGHVREAITSQRSRSAAGVAREAAWRSEFAADDYAVQRLVAANRQTEWSSDVALVAGIVLRFFHLCERLSDQPTGSDTHPPALERWGRIKALTHLEAQPDAAAQNLDLAYAAIENSLVRRQSGPT